MTRKKETVELVTVSQKRRWSWCTAKKAVLAREDVRAANKCGIGCTQASKQGSGKNELFRWLNLGKKVGLTALTDGKSIVQLS